MDDSLEALVRAGKLEKARAAADEILLETPDDRAALMTLAKVSAASGAFERAGAQVTLATLDGVDDVDSLVVKAAIAFHGRHDVEGAKALFEKARRLANPPRSEPHFGLGMVLASMGHFAAATNSLKQAVALDPTVGQYHFHLARVLLSDEKLAEALPHLQKAVELDPLYPPAYDACVVVLTEFGYGEAAERLLREGLKLMPEHPHLQAALSNVLLGNGKTREAMELVEKLAVEHPDDAGAIFNYARLMGATGRPDRALVLIRALEKRGPPAKLLPKLLGLKGMLLEALEQPDEAGAMAAYAKAAKVDCSDWGALNNLGHLLLRRRVGTEGENLGAAVEAFQESGRRAPHQLEPVLNLAVAFSRLGRKDLASSAARDVLARARAAQADLRKQAEMLLADLEPEGLGRP